MRPITVTAGPLASAVANNIAHSQSPSKGALTLDGGLVVGGVAILDNPRQALFTFAADESGHNLIVVGTNWAGDSITETVAGTTAGTVATVLSYKTITSITISANSTGAMTVGTNGVGESQWIRFDSWADGNISVQCNGSGAVNYTIKGSLDDPNSYTNPVTVANMTWVNFDDVNLVGQTGNAQGNYQFFTPTWAKIVLNSGTGSVTGTFVQISSVNY